MATCPNCGAHGYPPNAGFTLDTVLTAKPLGTWSVAGAQSKTVATARPRLAHSCGWSILGQVDDRHFVADPATETFPPATTPPRQETTPCE